MSNKWVSGLRLRIADHEGDHVDFTFYEKEVVIESENGDEVLLNQDDAVVLAREILKRVGESNG